MKPVCPACYGSLEPGANEWRCRSCEARYPSLDGIAVLLAPELMAAYRTNPGTIAEYYRAVAARYGIAHHVDLPGAKLFLERFAARVRSEVRPGMRVLEIGAGTGFATDVIAREASGLVVTDASLEMLMVARRRHPDLEMTSCAIEDLPFPEATFDVVIGNNTFYLVPDKVAGARSIARVLRPGGRLVLSEMNPYHPLWPLMFAIKRRLFERSIYDLFPERLTRTMATGGLARRELAYYSFAPYWASGAALQASALFEATLGRIEPLRRFTAIRMWSVFEKS